MITWLTILAMALVAYATRALPLLARWTAPHPLAQRALAHAPAAVLAALVAPALLAPTGALEPGPKLWAGLLGAAVAWRTLNVPLTIAAGLIAFAVLRGLLGE